MEEYSILPAVSDDVSDLFLLESAGFSEPWNEELLASHLAGVQSVSLICKSADGRPLGAALGLCLPPEGELYRITVLPSERRRGIGRRLLNAFLERLTAAGVTTCFLEVRAHNAPALALYAAAGFRQVGTRKNYYQNPADDAFVLRWG